MVNTYLNDPAEEFEMLKKYPPIYNTFVKFNTILPSSAPVERLFSFAGIVNAPRRSKLSDKNFEQLVLLKANFNPINFDQIT